MGNRGCITVDDRPICATKPGSYVGNRGYLEAGFPPTNMPDETYPLCRVHYSVPYSWAYVHFDVDEWCLRGMSGERKFSAIRLFYPEFCSSRADSAEIAVVVCCDTTKKYDGDALPSPYYLKNEGSTMSLGGHYTSWEQAFPSALKSLKDQKSSLTSLGPSNDAYAFDFPPAQPSWDDTIIRQQPKPALASGNVNEAAPGSTLSFNDDVGADNSPLITSINTPDLTALEPETESGKI